MNRGFRSGVWTAAGALATFAVALAVALRFPALPLLWSVVYAGFLALFVGGTMGGGERLRGSAIGLSGVALLAVAGGTATGRLAVAAAGILVVLLAGGSLVVSDLRRSPVYPRNRE